MHRFTARLLSAAALAALLPGVAAAMDMVVTSAQSSTRTVGQVIDASKKLTLIQGEQLTLISADGQSVTLAGPYDGTPAEKTKGGSSGDPKTVGALSALFTSQKKSTASLGAVRGVGTGTPEEPWAISVETSGPRCIKSSQVTLWRSDPSKPAQFTLSDGYRSAGPQPWPANAAQVKLPDGFIQGGKTYKITLDQKTVELAFITVPETTTNPAELAVWMNEKGCGSQAVALLSTLR